MVTRNLIRRLKSAKRLAPFGKESGFTYMAVLVLTAITGIALGGASQIWSTAVKREMEAELLWRGDRIRLAIESYYSASGNQPQGAYPADFQALLKDPRFPGARRHLRKLYADPMTGQPDWEVLRDGAGRIKGVYSRHKGAPMKTRNFPREYEDFQKAKTYSDWKFVYNP